MDKFSITKENASKIKQSLNETVSAGNSIPVESSWYTILPIGISRVCKMKRDLEDIDNLAKMHGDVKSYMFTNPIGSLIFPSCILKNFNFNSLAPADARAIGSMIRKKNTELASKTYTPKTEPVLTYSLRHVTSVKKLISDLTGAECSDKDTIVEIELPILAEYVAMSLYEQNKKTKQ